VKGTSFRAALGLTLALGAVVVPGAARADAGMSDDARAAYDRGTAAHARGDYRAAASELAEADLLAPNLVALKAALDEALLADDAELGMQLVERAHARAPGDASLTPSVRDAEARFTMRTGRVRIDCGGRPCAASIDGRRVAGAAPSIVLVGPHRVVIELDAAKTTRDLVVAGGREVDVVLPPAAVGRSAPAVLASYPVVPREKGVSPVAWFLVAAGVTAISGAATVVSGVDTANQHSSFVSHGCAGAGGGQCAELASNGSSAETRTNVLLGVTGALGAATVVLAFFVPWHTAPEPRAALVLGDRSASFRLQF
jgi:hypothetical protein